MSTVRKRHYAFYCVVVVLVSVVVGSIAYMIQAGGTTLPVVGQAPQFSATNVDGKEVRFNDTNGKIRLVTWIFTNCPDACPLTMHRLEQIQTQLQQEGLSPKRVEIIAMTIDPVRDTLPVLRKYVKTFHANGPGWYMLRATPANTTEILKAWGIQVKNGANPEDIEHAIQTDLVDGSGNIRVTYDSANLNEQQILQDIHALLRKSVWDR